VHNGVAPVPVVPEGGRCADEPRSRVGRRLLDLAEQPTRFPSDAFVARECITKAEWERRHAATYGGGATA
jgi:hypothetical protein